MNRMIPINLIVLMTISSKHSQSSFFVKRFFSKPWWLYSCLKSQKTIPGYYFNSNFYNIAFVHIIRIVISNCHVTDGWLLKAKIIFTQKCAIWSMWKVCHWKCMEFSSLVLSRSTREPNFIYKMRVCKLNRLCKFHVDST